MFFFIDAVHADTPKAEDEKTLTGMFTLYALDPCAQSFSFTKNCEGGVIRRDRVLSNGAEIDFGTYTRNAFIVAVSNGAEGAIVDLGTAEELQKKYDYQETVGNGEGFASIRRDGQKFLIGNRYKGENKSNSKELVEGSSLNGELKQLSSCPVLNGHIYLIRILKSLPEPSEIYVKLLVVAYQPNEFVTFRWVMIN